ncbi:MAG: PIN domain-containing protein [Chloroflexi bacterium]|nr:PIN domain-containing protein [Chloroflexota bacterium]
MKLYLDTSIPSVYHDPRDRRIRRVTRTFWATLSGRHTGTISTLVLAEIARAKPEKRVQLLELVADLEVLPVTSEAIVLAQSYLAAGAFSVATLEDAEHLATATVHHIPVVVSWNFNHMVKLKTLQLVGLVNADNGYQPITVVTPDLLLLPER